MSTSSNTERDAVTVRPGTIAVFSDLWCSFAHVAVHRLHATRHRLGLDHELRIDHHAFPLELFNRAPSPRPGTDSEVGGIAHLEPAAGWRLWVEPDWSFPTSTLPALEAVQAAKTQSLESSEALDLALRRAFWAENRCINNTHVILDVAAKAAIVDVDHLAAALDDGRARSLVTDDFHLAQAAGVVCSPHLYLPDGTNHPNPGIDVAWIGDYGEGFPNVRSDDPGIYETILRQAAG